MTDRITYSVLAAIAVVLVVAACSDTSKQPAAGVQVVASGSGDIATDAPDDTATASQDGAGGVLKDGAALVDSGAAQDSGAAVDALEDVGGAVVDTGTSTAPDVLTDAGQPVSDSGGPIDAGGGASDIVTIDITAVDSSANAPLWLLSIDNGGLLSDKWLQMVDIKTGKASNLCKLDTKDAYPSLTFSRDGILFASNNTQDRLDMIDPCTCKITPVGFFG